MIGDNIAFHWIFSFYKYSFQFICPILALVSCIKNFKIKFNIKILNHFKFLGMYSLATSAPINMGNYNYPNWTRILGISMNAFIVSGVVVFAIFKTIRTIIEIIKVYRET